MIGAVQRNREAQAEKAKKADAGLTGIVRSARPLEAVGTGLPVTDAAPDRRWMTNE